MRVNRPYADCKDDELHLADSVQSFGAMLAIDRSGVVQAASTNVAEFVGRSPQQLLGVPWRAELPGGLEIDAVAASALQLRSIRIGERPLMVALHRSNDHVLVELQAGLDGEESTPGGSPRTLQAIDALAATTTPRAAASVLMNAVADIVDFGRVMLYRFLPEWHGEVIDERLAPGMDGYLGLRFPESDLPANARRLYLHKRQRIIADVQAAPVPVVAGVAGLTLDLSGSELRSVHPVHLDYLRNMGVRASFSVSIVVSGSLWGMVACHHDAARVISFQARRACELIASVASIHIANLEQLERMRAGAVHAIERERGRSEMEAAPDGSFQLHSSLPRFRSAFAADGAFGRIDSRTCEDGILPQEPARQRLSAWLAGLNRAEVTASNRLPSELADDEELQRLASGILFVPLRGEDFLALTRVEQVEQVAWAGRPPDVAADSAGVLTPRNSFEVWRESTRGQATAWTEVEIESARELRSMLLKSIEHAELEHRASVDALTGLANRATFEDELRDALLQGAGAGVAVLMIDLDRFKPVNDRYGHAAGDRLLRAVADRLVAAVRENDLVARFGGDEFAALLRGVRRPEGAEETAARIVRGLQEPYDLAGTVVEIGGSVGVAVTDGTAPSVEVLLEWADRALYSVKRSGRNDFALYQPGMEQGGE